MDSVPQKRAKVMSEAFFRRFRYSLQKNRGRVRFIAPHFLRASMGSVEAAVRAGIIPATTPIAEQDQDRGDDDQRIEDGHADEVGETARRDGLGGLEDAGREAEADEPAEEHDHERLAEELPEDRPAAGARRPA